MSWNKELLMLLASKCNARTQKTQCSAFRGKECGIYDIVDSRIRTSKIQMKRIVAFA
jgi:hypothetical protein